MRNSPPPSSVEDVVELMHHIQLRLLVKDAARTSVLSKSWRHAWSTIPTLRLNVGRRKHMKVVDVERTLSRYLRDNIPIERFELEVNIENEELASVTEKWIRSVATKTCSLKELSLRVALTGASLMLPDEILSVAENLTKLTVSTASRQGVHSVWMKTPVSNNSIIINCVSLREVELSGMRISQELLDGIFSSCTLLEKIDLFLDKQYKGQGRNTMIKIKNLARLHEVIIFSVDGDSTDLEISGVPNLRLFRCDLCYGQFGLWTTRRSSIQRTFNINRKQRDGVTVRQSHHRRVMSGDDQVGISYSREFDPCYGLLDVAKLPFHMYVAQDIVPYVALPTQRAYRRTSLCSKITSFLLPTLHIA